MLSLVQQIFRGADPQKLRSTTSNYFSSRLFINCDSAIEEFKPASPYGNARREACAYRSLTEQIHGIYIQGETTVGEAVLTSDKLGAALRGTVMGARTVKIEPTGSDTYQVELSISQTHIDRLIKSYRRGLL